MNSTLLKILEQEKEQLLVKLSFIEQSIFTVKRYTANALSVDEAGKDKEAVDYSWLKKNMADTDRYFYYDRRQPSKIKVLMIIKTEKRFLHVREIARVMLQLEGVSDVQSLLKKISPALSILKRNEVSSVTSVQVGSSHLNTFWGCKEWLSNDGQIEKAYMYNEAEVSKPASVVLQFFK
jgi:hypothetical protein